MATPATTPEKSGIPDVNDPNCYKPVSIPVEEYSSGSKPWDATELIFVVILVFLALCISIGDIKRSYKEVSSFPESAPSTTIRHEADWTVKEIPSQKFQQVWEIKAGQDWHPMKDLMPEDFLEQARKGNAAIEWFGEFELKDQSGTITSHGLTRPPSYRFSQLLTSEIRATSGKSTVQLQLTNTN